MHDFHNFWSFGVVYLVVLACVLRATTKKGQLFKGKQCTRLIKILATPMNLPTPGKNYAGADAYQAGNV